MNKFGWLSIAILSAVFSLGGPLYAAVAVTSAPSPAPTPSSPSTPSITVTRPAAAVTLAPSSVTPAKATPKTSANNQPLIVARVVWVHGTFKATGADQKSRSLIKAAPIYLHDTLTTDSTTEAQIVFSDDTLMTFNPSSQFYVNDYYYNNSKATNKGSVGKYVMNLVEGGFRTITGLIAKANPTDYRVNTPVATIGVRGTDYAISLRNGELFIGYYAGAPCVSSHSETLCLDNKTPYAKVSGVNAVPIPLTQQPPVFQQKTLITNVTFVGITGSSATYQGSGNASGVLNSFCIQ